MDLASDPGARPAACRPVKRLIDEADDPVERPAWIEADEAVRFAEAPFVDY